jgi:hypothetical protein
MCCDEDVDVLVVTLPFEVSLTWFSLGCGLFLTARQQSCLLVFPFEVKVLCDHHQVEEQVQEVG